uniref:Calmodulin-lysine N-methyltransferase n=1 Tax=Craspedostauros australis TaxID=1486917 RepID=A0A7R9ZQJ1_9STRA|mmetsp:Transcript_5932/g.16114  ORF Transcript_5932/g.16114 Transcript_5932/m.16114 type:complete len:312 (+) Transcript_5932:222-1157(+)
MTKSMTMPLSKARKQTEMSASLRAVPRRNAVWSCAIGMLALHSATALSFIGPADSNSGPGRSEFGTRKLNEITQLNAAAGITTPALPTTATDAVVSTTPTETKWIDLGSGKSVEIVVPHLSGDASPTIPLTDVAMARILVDCPSLVHDRNVLELDAGLGLISSAICQFTKPEHVAVTDPDTSMLRHAYRSCTQLRRPKCSVSRCVMDWQDVTTWPNQEYDMIIASDVLNLQDDASLHALADVLAHYLQQCDDIEDDDECDILMKRAVIVDPIEDGEARARFSKMVRSVGLKVEEAPFPDAVDDFVILNITP